MIRPTLLLMSTLLISLTGCAQGIPNKAEQIATAVLAAPKDQRDGAAVMGYDAKGNIVVLRQGTNQLICNSDDPSRKGFQSVCYHKDLEPFMARGRQLKQEGKTADEIFEIREKEAKAGSLKMPEQPTTLHLLEEIGRASCRERV